MSKKIIYTLIAYNRTNLLCEFSEFTGNFQMNCLKVLKKVEFNHSASIDYQQYKFNYLDIDQLTILCFTHKDFPLEVSYCFLRDVLDDFKRVFSMDEIINIKTHFFCNNDFEHILKDKIHYYNINPECTDNLSLLNNQILEFKKNVLKAEALLRDRGEFLNEIIVKSEKLKTESDNYYKSAKKSMKRGRCNKWLWILFAVLALCILGWLISSLICGFDYSHCPGASSDDEPKEEKSFNYGLFNRGLS